MGGGWTGTDGGGRVGAGQAGCGEGWVALGKMHSLLMSWGERPNMRTGAGGWTRCVFGIKCVILEWLCNQ